MLVLAPVLHPWQWQLDLLRAWQLEAAVSEPRTVGAWDAEAASLRVRGVCRQDFYDPAGPIGPLRDPASGLAAWEPADADAHASGFRGNPRAQHTVARPQRRCATICAVDRCIATEGARVVSPVCVTLTPPALAP